jgi:hypothetical protein
VKVAKWTYLFLSFMQHIHMGVKNEDVEKERGERERGDSAHSTKRAIHASGG